MSIPVLRHRRIDATEAQVFVREAFPYDGPTGDAVPVLLLHGFPSSSHQFRRLIDELGRRRRVIAPDLPGFGFTSTSEAFTFTFESLAHTVAEVCDGLGLSRAVLYLFDYSGPVGLRLARMRPELVAGLVIQNANAYDEGLSPTARTYLTGRRGDADAERAIAELATLEGTRSQYELGASDLERLAPDAWSVDQLHLDRPGRLEAQRELVFDYATNLELYPVWQEWLRRHQPATLITWGKHDPFFTPDGARAYLRDLPDAELHLLDAAHFALEERPQEIAALVQRFLRRLDAAQPTTPAD